jgi:uncharacterized protein with PIN domain
MTVKRRQQGRGKTGELKIPCPSCNEDYLKYLYEHVSFEGKRNWIHRAYRCPKCGKISKMEE